MRLSGENSAGHGVDRIVDGLGRSLGEGLEALALIATLIAAGATLLAWSLLLHFGRKRSDLRAVGLVLVVAIHFLPMPFVLADPSPTASWSLAAQWRGWGAAAAWSLPGLAALLWFTPSLARAAIVACYAALLGTTIYLYQPGRLHEPLVEIVTTAREQWACGRTEGGDVLCIGGNEHGQIGTSSGRNLERPQKVDELSPASALFSGRFTTCALTPPSTVRCVGLWQGEGRQRFTARSSLAVTNVLVGESELVFVSREGAVEVWSPHGTKTIASNSAQQVQCGARIILLGEGRAEMRSTSNDRRVELGTAREIGCEEDVEGGRIVTLDGARLRYFKASGELDEEVEVPENASFAPADALIALRDGDRVARCAPGFAVFHRVGVSCEWLQAKRNPVRLRGTPLELTDTVTYPAQQLAAMSLALR